MKWLGKVWLLKMSRLDIELGDRGLFASRNKAQMEIKNGNIKCND